MADAELRPATSSTYDPDATPGSRVARELHSVRKGLEGVDEAVVIAADYVADIVRIPAMASAAVGTIAQIMDAKEDERTFLELFGDEAHESLDRMEAARGGPGVGGGLAPAVGAFSKFSREAAGEARSKLGLGPPTLKEALATIFLPVGLGGSAGRVGRVTRAASKEGGGGGAVISILKNVEARVKNLGLKSGTPEFDDALTAARDVLSGRISADKATQSLSQPTQGIDGLLQDFERVSGRIRDTTKQGIADVSGISIQGRENILRAITGSPEAITALLKRAEGALGVHGQPGVQLMLRDMPTSVLGKMSVRLSDSKRQANLRGAIDRELSKRQRPNPRAFREDD